MTPEIRPATSADHPAILQLWHQGWHDAHGDLVPAAVLPYRTPQHFEAWLAECVESFFVATVESAVLGFHSVEGAELVKLYVSRDAKGSGIARALLSHAETVLAAEGVSRAELFCTAGNLRAERFYAREGWRLAETYRDALWMPPGVSGTIETLTHRYVKDLSAGA